MRDELLRKITMLSYRGRLESVAAGYCVTAVIAEWFVIRSAGGANNFILSRYCGLGYNGPCVYINFCVVRAYSALMRSCSNASDPAGSIPAASIQRSKTDDPPSVCAGRAGRPDSLCRAHRRRRPHDTSG